MPTEPTLLHARLAEAEWAACAHLTAGRRSPLSPLPAAGRAPEASAPVWQRLTEIGIATVGEVPVLTPQWQTALDVLANARSRCRLALGTPEWIELSGFYVAGPWQRGSLVSCVPADGGCGIGFPSCRQDVADLVFNHLGDEVLPEPSGFRARFDALEFATLLAMASSREPVSRFTAQLLVEACAQPRPHRASPALWAGVAPWSIVLDEPSATSGLAAMRAHGCAYSVDGVHYASAPALADLLQALRDMERYAAVDFVAERPGGGERSFRFLVFISHSAWWMLDYGGDDRARAGVWVQSIVPQQLELVFARLARLTSLFRKEETMNHDEIAAPGAIRSYELTEEELHLLVTAIGCPPAPGAPVATLRPRSEALEQRARQTLRERGLLVNDHPEPGLALALAALAQPAFEIAEVGGVLPALAGTHAYGSASRNADATIVGYRNAGPEHHILRFPLPTEEVLPVTHALLRTGRAGSVAPFSAVLDQEEYAVLLALVDLYRSATLSAAMNRQSRPQFTVTAEGVDTMFRQGAAGADCRWLVTLGRELSLRPLSLPTGRIPGILTRLAQRGLLSVGEHGFRLSADCAAFCHCLSVAEAAVGVALATTVGAERTEVAGFMAFWAGGMLWLVDYTHDGQCNPRMSLSTVLPLELRLAMRTALQATQTRAGSVPPGGAKEKPSAQEPPPRPVTESVCCPACGAVVPSDARFCIRCGADLAPHPEPTCPACRAVVPVHATFCPACGLRLAEPPAPHGAPPAPKAPQSPSGYAEVTTQDRPLPTSKPPGAPPPLPSAQRCCACGALLRPATAYCTHCGAPRGDPSSP